MERQPEQWRDEHQPSISMHSTYFAIQPTTMHACFTGRREHDHAPLWKLCAYIHVAMDSMHLYVDGVLEKRCMLCTHTAPPASIKVSVRMCVEHLIGCSSVAGESLIAHQNRI